MLGGCGRGIWGQQLRQVGALSPESHLEESMRCWRGQDLRHSNAADSPPRAEPPSMEKLLGMEPHRPGRGPRRQRGDAESGRGAPSQDDSGSHRHFVISSSRLANRVLSGRKTRKPVLTHPSHNNSDMLIPHKSEHPRGS